jgi:CRP-like cAMP-binding protein
MNPRGMVNSVTNGVGRGELVTPVTGSFLSFLGEEDGRALLAGATKRWYAKDDVLMRESDPTDHVLVLVEGWVRVSVVSSEGQEVLLALRGPGDLIGELAALNGSARSATVRSIEDVQVVQFVRADFVARLHARPSIAIGVIQQLATRLHQAEEVRVDFVAMDVSQRVAALLDDLGVQHGVRGPEGITLRVPLTQQDIANRIGASRRAVARAMALLRERGIASTVRGRILIARPDVLRKFARTAHDGGVGG